MPGDSLKLALARAENKFRGSRIILASACRLQQLGIILPDAYRTDVKRFIALLKMVTAREQFGRWPGKANYTDLIAVERYLWAFLGRGPSSWAKKSSELLDRALLQDGELSNDELLRMREIEQFLSAELGPYFQDQKEGK